ncbi:MAG: AI-2E family transporter [Anaerolineales bacterium]
MTQTPSEDDRSLGSRVLGLWVAYVKGQLLISLLIGALTWIVSAGIGLSGAAVLGALAGVLESIPNLGPLIALVPAVAMALWKGSSVIPVSNWVFALIVVGAYLAVQQIGNLFLQPRILSEQLRLPPLVVFLAVIVGAAVAGVLGAYLAVPVLATLREFGVYWRQRRSV